MIHKRPKDATSWETRSSPVHNVHGFSKARVLQYRLRCSSVWLPFCLLLVSLSLSPSLFPLFCLFGLFFCSFLLHFGCFSIRSISLGPLSPFSSHCTTNFYNNFFILISSFELNGIKCAHDNFLSLIWIFRIKTLKSARNSWWKPQNHQMHRISVG